MRWMDGESKKIHDVCISPDNQYRYWLEAKVSDDERPVCMFLMLNPSAADAIKSDPTLNACKRFARDWGYGTVRVCNLFALRSPYPKDLKENPNPVGAENDGWILQKAGDSDVIVCGWGNHGVYLDRSTHVRQMLEREGLSSRMRHLGLTKMGQPRHPQRLNTDTLPMRF